MKTRKPHRFSDSKIVKESQLNRSVLEYRLSVLGNNKQEQDFEEFARKLCQYEICPNLRPQTGSTGGGDSKTDSSTIPVASQIRASFFQGQDNQNKEEFAFAFSTQKDWSGKIRNDVEEIHKTGRAYAKVFCVTSEYARDKTRASLEDELSTKYGFQVVILDKNWILDKVFSNKRQRLAIEELKLGEGLEEKIEIGPLDYQRKKQLSDLNSSIAEAVSKNQVTIKIVDDSLDAALIAVELEEPRQEVEGLFERAIRFAKEYGTDGQYFTATYQRAWTTFFWFEDFKTFLSLYEEVESLALVSNNIFTAERLSNLWTLFKIITSTTDLVSVDLLKEKTQNLFQKLNEHKNNEANSSASVQAEALLCFAHLLQHRNDSAEVTKIFTQLKSVVDRAGSLIGFPFEIICQIVNEMDDQFNGDEAYEDLQGHLVEVITKREGELSAGKLLLNRGKQHLKGRRIYQAIDALGRALKRFYKKESKDELVHALFLLSIAYEDAGLLWAARGVLLNAASHATSDFWLYDRINTMQLSCYERLKTIELRLGRVGYALEWHRLHIALASQLAKSEEEKSKLLDESLHFGSVMGLLLIKTPDKDLKSLEKLPDTLVQMDLDFAAFGLIYRLGGKDSLPSSFLNTTKPEEIESFFNSWLTQPAQESLPETPSYYEDDIVELKSNILGCDYIVKTGNNSPDIEVGEYVIAALEGFLSTSIEFGAISRDRNVLITVTQDETQKEFIKYTIRKDGEFGVAITCSNFNPHTLSAEQQEAVAASISEIILQLVANTVVFKSPNVDLLKLFKDEEVGSRAFSFTTPMVTLGNVLGYKPNRSIANWILTEAIAYPYIPEKSGKPIQDQSFKKMQGEKRGDSPKRHNEVKNLSVIRQHLWDEAEWMGVLYMTAADRPPLMALIFKNEEKARAIFKDWKETFGNKDESEVIRVSAVREVSVKNPTWYRIGITTNFNRTENPSSTRFVIVSRVFTLTADTTANLDRFSESFKEFGHYLLVPAVFVDAHTQPKVLFDSGVIKTAFNDRHAWEVGVNDPDAATIRDETEPIIPEGKKDAPLLELLKKRKASK